MNKICTSIEQSKKLIELGIDRKSSDMYYWCGEDLRIGGYKAQDDEYDIPAWSLAALISIIPQKLFGGEYIINITKGLKYKWIVSYEPSFIVSPYIHVSNDSLIDCCVEIISKLKERNLL